MFYESLIILNISTLNFSEGVPASVLRNNKKGGGGQKMATFDYVQKDLKTNICLFSAPVF